MNKGIRLTRPLVKWTAGLEQAGWAVEYFESGLIKSNPDGGREGYGGLAICAPGIAIAFAGSFGRLSSGRRCLWDAVQLFDATDESYRIATFGLGVELGVITFMSDRPWLPNPGAPFRGPRNDIADGIRHHLPSDGWDGPFKWSVHSVTKTKEELASFVLSFLVDHKAHGSAGRIPAHDVALRCAELLGRAEANGLLAALNHLSVEDRVAAIDAIPSIADSRPLRVWFHTLAGLVEEGLDFDSTTLSEARGQLISSLRENLTDQSTPSIEAD